MVDYTLKLFGSLQHKMEVIATYYFGPLKHMMEWCNNIFVWILRLATYDVSTCKKKLILAQPDG
jgi:hypothetical protein